MKEKKNKKTIEVGVYMDRELFTDVDQAATESKVSRSEWIREACREKLGIEGR